MPDRWRSFIRNMFQRLFVQPDNVVPKTRRERRATIQIVYRRLKREQAVRRAEQRDEWKRGFPN